MANLGKWGALAGLGQGITEHGNTIREQWLQAEKADQQLRLDDAKDKRGSAEWDRRHAAETNDSRETNDLRNQYEISLEGVRHKNRMAEDAAKNAKTANGEPVKLGDTLYRKDSDGSEYLLNPNPDTGVPTWQKIGAPGSSNSAEQLKEAKAYAKSKVAELDGWFGNGFDQYGGSKADAEQALINEWFQKYGVGRLSGGVSLNTPPNGAAPSNNGVGNPSQQLNPQRQQISEALKQTASNAQAAIQRGVPKEMVIQRLKEAGATDSEIQQLGIQ